MLPSTLLNLHHLLPTPVGQGLVGGGQGQGQVVLLPDQLVLEGGPVHQVCPVCPKGGLVEITVPAELINKMASRVSLDVSAV